MPSIATDLAAVLRTIRHHGDFYASGAIEMPAPNLEVDGVGLISLPFQQIQLDQLIARAERAPFGRGAETLVDTGVRRTWQIDARHLRFAGRHWQRTLDAIVERAGAGLGAAGPVSAELYKLLVYDAGSFFVEHRDTEKAPGMFATLVVVLPSVYSGGELLVRHGAREARLDLACPDPSDAAFAAFYADCVHEVLPVASGTRLVLVYNLLRKGGAAALPPEYGLERERVAALLLGWTARLDAGTGAPPDKLVYPLEHAYSAAELGFDALKGADAAAAGVLVAAAAQAGCEVHLAQLSIEESGTAEYADYRPRRYGRYAEPDDADFEVGEILDGDASVSGWRAPDGAAPALGALPLADEELCPPDAFDGVAPDEQHFRGATGNEGASFERSYRRAALVLWPRARRLAVVNQGGLAATLPLLEELARRWADGVVAAPCAEARALAGYMLRDWPRGGGPGGEQAARMLACLARLRDAALVDAFLADISACGGYAGNENDALALAMLLLPPGRAAELLERIIAANATFTPGACADLLGKASAGRDNAAVLFAPAAAVLLDALLGVHESPARPGVWRRRPVPDATVVVNTLAALHLLDAEAMADRALRHMLAGFPVDAVLVPAALALAQRAGMADFAPSRLLRSSVLAHLRERIALPLAPPADFTRPSALDCRCEHCVKLALFLADPALGSWTFKAAERHRQHLQEVIREELCDVDCVTLRQSNPHSLVCTKNQSSYRRRVVQRGTDVANVEALAAGG